MTRLYSFLTIAVFLLSTLSAEAGKPRWVKKRPSDRNFYIGIGMAYKKESSGLDYAKKARADALKEMASEIEVNVSANSLMRQFEDNFNFRETFESEISTSAEENLAGYEVKTWENRREYWVLMKLSKEQYQRRKRLDLEMAKKKAASYLLEARRMIERMEITAALGAYFKAIESLENHLKEDLTYRSIDGNINFGSDIMQDLRYLFSKISITPVNPNYQVSFSKSMEKPLKAKVEYYSSTGRKVPVRSFPVHYKFIQGQGLLQEKATSNPGGEVNSYIQKLESSLKKQQVEVAFDHTVLLQEENIQSPLVKFFLPEETIPTARFNIELQKSNAWLTASELVFGKATPQKLFSNQLKSHLNETFFNFTQTPDNAPYIIEVNANFKKGDIKEGNGYTVYLVYADLYISVISAETKTEIFSETISGVKGMRPGSFDYALKEARQKLLERFEKEVYPQLEALNF
ncbi:LPP20 family lipoprotein [Marinilabilia sp.]